MSRFESLRRAHTKRLSTASRALMAGVLGVTGAVMFLGPANAEAPSGPAPATSDAVTLSASPVVGLSDGQTVTFSVHTTGATKLVGGITARLCKHGLTGYGFTNFGYDDGSASRCIYAPGIVSGGINGADYEKTYGPYAGSESTSGALTFHAGTGAVTWGNNGGFGPFSTQADITHQIDLVIEVNLAGDSVARTWFVQPLTFSNVPGAPPNVVGITGAAPKKTGPITVTYDTPPDRGSAITKYTATCTSANGGATRTGVHTGPIAKPITVIHTTTGKKYRCTVTATNAVGTSGTTTASPGVIVGTPAPVSKPTIAKIGSGHLKITFRRLNGGRLNGGSLVNPAYVAVCASSNGGVPHQGTATKKQSRIDIKHLTAGKKYTCTVKAQNTRGVSLPSLPSNQTKA